MKLRAILFIILLSALSANAGNPEPEVTGRETVRPVASAYTFEIGSSHIADTYLSPITYRGWSAAFAYERMQAMKFDPERWVMQLDARAEIDRGRNHADNATTWRLDLSAKWGMMRRWSDILIPKLTLAVGGSTGIGGGCIYNSRNGNNPASAKLAWTVNLTGFAAYNLRIGHLKTTLRYQPTLPLLGAFFAPDYDELYYEIYLGNHSGLAHFAWPGNRFEMTNLLTADFHLGNTVVRVGYRNLVYSSEINHLVTNVTTHSFLFGLAGEWISAGNFRKISRNAAVISAVY